MARGKPAGVSGKKEKRRRLLVVARRHLQYYSVDIESCWQGCPGDQRAIRSQQLNSAVRAPTWPLHVYTHLDVSRSLIQVAVLVTILFLRKVHIDCTANTALTMSFSTLP